MSRMTPKREPIVAIVQLGLKAAIRVDIANVEVTPVDEIGHMRPIDRDRFH